MALPSLVLDDFTWADLTAATRRRIPAASNGKWTLHSPVDPGVTLVELYAWLLEQRAFWLDQVPDSLVRAILRLLGDDVGPAVSAATVLALPPRPWTTFAADSVLHTDRRAVPLRFTTDGGITLLPVDRVGLVSFGSDRSNDLAAGRAVRIFPADGSAAEARLIVWLPTAPAAGLTEPLSLLLELLTPEAIPHGWSPRAVPSVPPPAALSFFYRNVAGHIRPWPAPVDDGTGGLRRSGVLRLPVPADWTFEPGSTVAGVSAFAVIMRTDAARFTASPRLVRLTPNVVVARHRRPSDVQQIVDWLPLPGNIMQLRDEDRPPLAETVELSINEASGWQTWRPTPDLAFHGPADRVFVVDRDAGALRFGDGLTGRIPRPLPGNNFNIVGTLDVGGGSDGNLGAGCGWVDEGSALTAANVVPAEDGADPEPLADARRRATAELHQVTRAVTQLDYETLAVTTPGVALARAHAAVGYHPLHACTPVPGFVSVFVVPDAPREEPSDFVEDAFVAAPQPDPGALAAAQARLDAARLVTHEVCVRGPIYRRAALLVEAFADPADPPALRARVSDRLRRFLDPLLGGEDGGGWPFGDPLRPSQLVRQVELALGGDGEVARVAIGLDGNAPSESCHDVSIGPHALVGAVAVTVRFSPKPSGRQGLR